MAYPGYFGPQRTSNQIVLYLSPKQPAPEAPPIELRNHISKDAWNVRLPAVTRVASRYSKPILERIWFGLAFLSIIVAPVVVYAVLVGRLRNQTNGNGFADSGFGDDNNDNASRFFEARAISFGLFFALGFLFYVPMGIWKYMGHRRVGAMLLGWAREDRAIRGPGASIPSWSVRTPGVFSSNITLTITVPSDVPPSTFHPDAYLPSYINGPMDADAQIYNPYNAQPDFQHSNAIGNVPLYTDEKYQNPFTDDKIPFEDVKV